MNFLITLMAIHTVSSSGVRQQNDEFSRLKDRITKEMNEVHALISSRTGKPKLAGGR